jgi:hypothetical protein
MTDEEWNAIQTELDIVKDEEFYRKWDTPVYRPGDRVD